MSKFLRRVEFKWSVVCATQVVIRSIILVRSGSFLVLKRELKETAMGVFSHIRSHC